MIEFNEGAVCFAYGRQWLSYNGGRLDNGDKSVNFTAAVQMGDFQLNTPTEGWYIHKSEIDTEQKYNDAVEVFGLFGFDTNLSYESHLGYMTEYFVIENDELDGVRNEKDYCKTKCTYNQLMAIGKLKRMIDEKSNSKVIPNSSKPENTGFSCDYYKVLIENPTTASAQYAAECNDVIESLNMTYAEANMFKEIWRTAAARTLGKQKANHTSKRGAEKIIFFAERHGVQHGVNKTKELK